MLPVRTGAPTPPVAAAAIRWAPLVGALLGAAAGGLLLGLAALGVPPLAGGLLAVGFLALATRGMHLDGLADTADGLGCYGPPERALAVMRDGGAGPFAVVTLVVVLGAQAAALAALASARTGACSARGAGRRGRPGRRSAGCAGAGCPRPGPAGWAPPSPAPSRGGSRRLVGGAGRRRLRAGRPARRAGRRARPRPSWWPCPGTPPAASAA